MKKIDAGFVKEVKDDFLHESHGQLSIERNNKSDERFICINSKIALPIGLDKNPETWEVKRREISAVHCAIGKMAGIVDLSIVDVDQYKSGMLVYKYRTSSAKTDSEIAIAFGKVEEQLSHLKYPSKEFNEFVAKVNVEYDRLERIRLSNPPSHQTPLALEHVREIGAPLAVQNKIERSNQRTT